MYRIYNKIKTNIIFIIVYILICNFLYFINIFFLLPVFIYCIILWLYRLINYKNINYINELKPQKLNLKSTNNIVNFFFTYLIIKPYLSSYGLIYYTLNKNKLTKNKIEILLNFLKNLLSRLIIGFSIGILKKSNIYTHKLINTFSVKSDNHLQLFFYNILLVELNDIIILEKLKIYKTEKNKYNFNPNKLSEAKEKAINILITLMPKFNFYRVDSLTTNEKKLGQMVNALSKEFKKDMITGYLSIENKPETQHKGTMLKVPFFDYDEKIEKPRLSALVTNFTSQPQLAKNLKNTEIAEKSFLTPTIGAKYENIKLNAPTNLNINDNRIGLNLVKITEFWLITSLGMESNYFGVVDPNTNKIIVTEDRKSLSLYDKLKISMDKYRVNKHTCTFDYVKVEINQINAYMTEFDENTQTRAVNIAINELLNDEDIVNQIIENFQDKLKN